MSNVCYHMFYPKKMAKELSDDWPPFSPWEVGPAVVSNETDRADNATEDQARNHTNERRAIFSRSSNVSNETGNGNLTGNRTGASNTTMWHCSGSYSLICRSQSGICEHHRISCSRYCMTSFEGVAAVEF